MNDINFTKVTCPLADTLSDPITTIGQQSFTHRMLGRMCAMAGEEIGDTLPSNAKFFATETKKENPMWQIIHDARATEIAFASLECLDQRFMGHCAAKGCIDREDVTQMIIAGQQQMAEEAK